MLGWDDELEVEEDGVLEVGEGGTVEVHQHVAWCHAEVGEVQSFQLAGRGRVPRQPPLGPSPGAAGCRYSLRYSL